MDESTWRLAQIIMWLFGIQTLILGGIFGYILARLSKIDTKIESLDKRLVAIETILHMKECCMLNSDKQLKKAE